MRKKTNALVFAVCGSLALFVTSFAQEGLQRGEDKVDAPAVGEGFCLHNIFQSNMVLQRDKPLKIRGWAEPGASVTVVFGTQKRSAEAKQDRSWEVLLEPMPASPEPQRMTVESDGKTLTLDNILLGDVWLLGGQSNMEFPLAKVENGELEILSAHYDNIRILTVPAQVGPEHHEGFARLHEWSSWNGRHFRKGDWDVCTPESVREFSAIGYVFARCVHMASRIPIGVIDVSRGGTTVETWTPEEVLKTIESAEVKELLAEWDKKVTEYDPQQDLQDRIRKHQEWVAKMEKEGKPIPADRKVPADLRPGPAKDQNRPGNCYAGMIAPIAGFPVKGAIFHQGYNNCFNGSRGAVMYAGIFPKMIAAWRDAFNDAAMPFGIISLCTEGPLQNRDNFVESMANAGPYIREAQYKTFLDLYKAGDRNIGFASSYDLRRRWYHPQLKIPAGVRIARWALATQYGFEGQLRWKPPVIEQVKVEPGRILLHFDEPVGAIDNGGPIEGFAIAGEDRRFHPADAVYFVSGKDDRGKPKTDSKILELSSPMVPSPVHYRYAWARNPMGNLQTQHHSDVPMATQRSDNWHLNEVPVEFGDYSDGRTRNEIRQRLQQEDLDRRLDEARKRLEAHSTDNRQ